jgi:hypothetical protein
MSSRKPKQDIEYLDQLDAPLLLLEAVPSKKAPAAAPRARWDASSELIIEVGGKLPRSRLH